MTRRFIIGGTQGELLPSGEFVVNLRRAGMVTHLGAVAFPPGETGGVLFPRCSILGGFKFAGQRNDVVSKAVEYIGGRWIVRDDLPFPDTNWPVIYDRLGQLHSNPVGAAGSQGYRFVRPDNTIATGDETYGPFHGLSEWTDLGDGLYVGQASDDYAAVLYDARRDVRLLLETGYRRFIVANREAETVTICMADPSGCILLQTTMSELRARPVFAPVATPAPPPAPTPTPPPSPPSPVPTPTPSEPPVAHPMPKGQTVVHVDVTPPLTKAASGEKIDNDDGTISIKTDQGYLSVDSTGTVKFQPSIGNDEKFRDAGDALIAINTFDGYKAWILPCRETV